MNIIKKTQGKKFPYVLSGEYSGEVDRKRFEKLDSVFNEISSLMPESFIQGFNVVKMSQNSIYLQKGSVKKGSRWAEVELTNSASHFAPEPKTFDDYGVEGCSCLSVEDDGVYFIYVNLDGKITLNCSESNNPDDCYLYTIRKKHNKIDILDAFENYACQLDRCIKNKTILRDDEVDSSLECLLKIENLERTPLPSHEKILPDNLTHNQIEKKVSRYLSANMPFSFLLFIQEASKSLIPNMDPHVLEENIFVGSESIWSQIYKISIFCGYDYTSIFLPKMNGKELTAQLETPAEELLKKIELGKTVLVDESSMLLSERTYLSNSFSVDDHNYYKNYKIFGKKGNKEIPFKTDDWKFSPRSGVFRIENDHGCKSFLLKSYLIKEYLRLKLIVNNPHEKDLEINYITLLTD